jgi:hypothetical protein
LRHEGKNTNPHKYTENKLVEKYLRENG